MTNEHVQHRNLNRDTELGSSSRKKRVASLYDAVAGRIGLSGFLTETQNSNPNLVPATPEEVLLRRVGAPDQIPYDYYDADEKLQDASALPDSELLKAIHAYTADFYHANTDDGGISATRSFDETALLALGILLEEASKEAIGENGDLALTEPMHRFDEPVETKAGRYQIIGRVAPRRPYQPGSAREFGEDELLDEVRPRKKQK